MDSGDARGSRSADAVQEELFGEPPLEPQPASDRPPRPKELPGTLRLGTSSWAFPGWEGLVYAGRHRESELARRGLSAYSRHPLLTTVGVDRGYYRPLPEDELRALAGQVPPHFRFLLKAPAEITAPRGAGRPRDQPNRFFLDASRAEAVAVRPFAEGLGDRGGVLLFQFPPTGVRAAPRAREFLRRIGAFLRELPRGPTYAVEVRDPLLWTEELGDELRKGGAVPSYSVHPRVPALERQVEILPPHHWPVLVCRWMLPPGLGYEEARARHAPFDALGAPDPHHRETVAELCAGAARGGRPAFVIVNNKAEGSAPASVEALAGRVSQLLGGRARQDSNLGPSA